MSLAAPHPLASRPAPARPVRQQTIDPAIDPAARILALIVFALATLGLHHLLALGAAFFIAVLMLAASRPEIASTAKKLAAFEGFMLAVLALLPFTTAGEPLATLAGWPVSKAGVAEAFAIVLRSNTIVILMLALFGRLETSRIGPALGRLGVAAKFVQLLIFTVRYIAVLQREYRRLRQAMLARGFKMRCNRHTWQSVGYLIGMLAVRSLDRSERIVAAMRCRGFDGRFRSSSPEAPLSLADYGFVAGFLLAAIALIALDRR